MLPIYEIRKSDLSVKHNTYELSFPEHMHKYTEIVYVYEGVQHLKIEDISYELNKGDIAVIFPDTVHSFYKSDESSDKKSSEVLILISEPKLFGGLFPQLTNFRPQEPIIHKEHINNELKCALECIQPNEDFEVMFSWTCVIISYIFKILSLKSHTPMPVKDITHKIIKYIEENYTEQITRETLAREFNVSEHYISRVFSEKIKMNMRSYLGVIRTEYAATLIRTSDETLTTISQMSGFDSQRTFNRVFKSVYKLSPKEYKNNINQFLKTE